MYICQNFIHMQTASLSGLLETLLYIIAIYYLLKFVARLLLPIMVQKVVQKAGENFQQHYQQQQSGTAQQQDEIIYDNTAKQNKPRETKIVGEYVDYEEIE